jgi:hypothetical protein
MAIQRRLKEISKTTGEGMNPRHQIIFIKNKMKINK